VVKIRWDPAKAESNLRKHGVRFEEAETVFADRRTMFRPDPDHSDEEDRYHMLGRSIKDDILVVTYTIRDDDYWLITARVATKQERRRYIMTHDILRDRPPDDDEDEGINFEDTPPLDFSKPWVRGLHTLSRKVVITVGLYEDVAEHFKDQDAVNWALREVIAVGNAPDQRGY
jgi:uncharacterized protein